MKNIQRNLLLFLALLCVTNLFAQETKVMVRVMAKDAKFIGSSIGGSKIFIKDAETGAVLSSGLTTGSTGDTKLIMDTPHTRNLKLTNAETAGFEAKLDIQNPTFVTIEAHAPISKKNARVISSTQLWLIPGKDILGDGIVLEVPGFVVDILSPQTHEIISKDANVEITANVVMMCGCPITDGGTWDASNYEVKAQISKDGTLINEVDLTITEKSSTYKAETSLTPGNYNILIYAYDSATGNTGVDQLNFIVK